MGIEGRIVLLDLPLPATLPREAEGAAPIRGTRLLRERDLRSFCFSAFSFMASSRLLCPTTVTERWRGACKPPD